MDNHISGHFLDTSLVFDSILPTRPLFQNFQKFYAKFLPFSIGITLSVNREVQKIAVGSAGLLVKYLHNAIATEEWDSLNIAEKEKLLDGVRGDMANDKRLEEVENKKIFVLDAFNSIRHQFISSSKKEIINLLPTIPDEYIRKIQQLIKNHFLPTPVNTDHASYNSWKNAIKLLNKNSNIFKEGESGDYEIFSDIILLSLCGAKYGNWNTASFDDINFYCNDRLFRNNIEKLEIHTKSKDDKIKEELELENAFKKIKTINPFGK